MYTSFKKIIKSIMGGYGSFFGLNNPLSQILIFLAAIMQPESGFWGLVAGSGVVFWHRLLQITPMSERIEVVNGLLLGMLLGSYGVSKLQGYTLVLLGSLCVVIISAMLWRTINTRMGLPLLGLPYALSAFITLPLLSYVPLAPLHTIHNTEIINVNFLNSLASTHAFQALGAMYFNGTVVGGILVFLAFYLSSRYLAMLAILTSIISSLCLKFFAIDENTLLFLMAQMNAVLTTSILGGLYTTPGKHSALIALLAGITSALITVSFAKILWCASLPVLTIPFVICTYTIILALKNQSNKTWLHFWLTSPALPEISIENVTIAKVRGIDSRSISLKAPFEGIWQIYQGFNGTHTHQGNFYYSLDFFQTRSSKSFRNFGLEKEDYYCWNQPILAPAFGTVVAIQSDLPDNKPGEVDLINNWGNYIIIQLDCGYYLVLAHLAQNSIKIALQSRVIPGQWLASCGNSGRSPQPHLHMHIQENFALGSQTLAFHLSGILSKNTEDEPTAYLLNCVPKENSTLFTSKRNLSLKRSLKFNVGSQFEYELFKNNLPAGSSHFIIKLDDQGQFWLQSKTGAKVAFIINDEIIAFYNRLGPCDPVLDALILSLSLTPFTEESIVWQDAIAKKLLPLTFMERIQFSLFSPFSLCTNSNFSRQWDKIAKVWRQLGTHTMKCRSNTHTFKSQAYLCEQNGLVSFALFRDEDILVQAKLKARGSVADNGIPALMLKMEAKAHLV